VINGISQGSAYALIALGYTMVYGVLRLINFAHGDVYMFGAFMGYYLGNSAWLQPLIGTSFLAVILIMIGSMTLSALLGIVIERFAYRPGRDGSSYTLALWLGILGAAASPLVASGTAPVVGGVVAGVVLGLLLEKAGIRPV